MPAKKIDFINIKKKKQNTPNTPSQCQNTRNTQRDANYFSFPFCIDVRVPSLSVTSSSPLFRMTRMRMAIIYHIQTIYHNHLHQPLVRVGHSVLKDGFLRYVFGVSLEKKHCEYVWSNSFFSPSCRSNSHPHAGNNKIHKNP